LRPSLNYGKLIAGVNCALCFGASAGYLLARNTRLSLYWFFAGCITAVMTF